ncbi:hypothetical protein Deipe_3461 [Deinococcus peraridilitoris DSM 19664]|uniref:Uncharacterized protein n=1 Tax=Deinococcus peraridilitoris (strain DSM 19664 / LMG 22246 / CIP 109416 / KR-200) TaxID=937777 RepID=L0A616_DEIPD|nr:hypothetical protein Deipe_3461 [Deinococcus peraridilitoris DSM 19664]
MRNSLHTTHRLNTLGGFFLPRRAAQEGPRGI